MIRERRSRLSGSRWTSPREPWWLGRDRCTCHGLDVPLTFGVYAGFGEMLTGPAPTPEVEATSAAIRSAWTRFAATGEPGWPAYSPEQCLVRLLDAQPHTAAYPEDASRILWQDHIFAALPLRGRR